MPTERDPDDAAAPANGKTTYRAPALEKGLDILELLATEHAPLTLTAIVQRLQRSTGELFRMIQVLEQRGFVEQTMEGYSLTSRLFDMGLGRPPIRNLVETALPVMRSLSLETKQSCHLVFASSGDMVVVARMESSEQLGFSVRVGHRRPIHHAASGIVLYAFQPAEVRAQWETLFVPPATPAERADLHAEADATRARGHFNAPSSFTEGITELSAPILRGDHAAAALAIPFVRTKVAPMALDDVVLRLCDAASAISRMLSLNDGRI
ncbi:IclR family transcriptional regulator [Sphingomonas sp. PP-CE-3G-477]|uniref:IclR family transcriptional regulator n=1 Tax=Sphingomonas sp. PP-CE-3G-477 TaxID=2135660 RepID=UPI000D34EAB5|nr:IclR family transcriptional regulator [Sphingomonas sp. PP-CE-3G-477]PTQ65819.1 IclR family transcriptional regulator [Sphingomonas sp. PP-CE-3G-477]